MVKRLRTIVYHPLCAAASNLLVLMLIYSLTRLFLYLVCPGLFPNVTSEHLLEMMLGGMRFDLTAVLYLSSVYLVLVLLPLPEKWRMNKVYARITKGFYLVPNALGILANCIDITYIPFSDRRATCTIFTEFGHDSNLPNIFLHGMVDYWYVSLFTIGMLALLWVCYRSPRLAFAPARASYCARTLYYLRETAILLVVVYFTVIGIRGGFGRYTRPITISNAMQYVNHPTETALVLNTPFSLMKSIEITPYANPAYFPEKEMARIYSPEHMQKTICAQEVAPNIAVLILESFATEHIGFFNPDLDGGNYRGFTPFLDSLLAHSVTFTHSYASGRKSIDAMPSVLSGIPMLIEPYIVTPYATNTVSSMADVLGQQGYCSAFFHGAPNGSMGFQAYARSAGFQHYYGMDEYNADPLGNRHAFDGTWAIWDEDFLQFYCRTMTTMPEPFCTAVFTASSHHPFRVPEQYADSFPKGPQPLCECIAYTDHALRRFFDEAARQPWFEHTLFVITADHTSQLYHDEYLNEDGLFRVPIAFYMPAALTPRVDSTQVVSQTDIMPSVLAFVGNGQPFIAFGEDALCAGKSHNYAVCYQHPYFQIMSEHGLLLFDGKDVVSVQGTPTEEEQEDMLRYLKAYIQQYILRMINNQLTIIP